MRREPKSVPLWVWLVAVQWMDIVWSVLVLLGVEKLRILPGFTEANALDLYLHAIHSWIAWIDRAFPRSRCDRISVHLRKPGKDNSSCSGRVIAPALGSRNSRIPIKIMPGATNIESGPDRESIFMLSPMLFVGSWFIGASCLAPPAVVSMVPFPPSQCLGRRCRRFGLLQELAANPSTTTSRPPTSPNPA
jgi:hypothetical protein